MKRAVMIVCSFNGAEISQVIQVVVDSTVNEHLRVRVVAVDSDVCVPSCAPLYFFRPVDGNDNLINVGKPLSIKNLPSK